MVVGVEVFHSAIHRAPAMYRLKLSKKMSIRPLARSPEVRGEIVGCRERYRFAEANQNDNL